MENTQDHNINIKTSKQRYLELKAKLALQNKSLRSWVEEKINEELNK